MIGSFIGGSIGGVSVVVGVGTFAAVEGADGVAASGFVASAQDTGFRFPTGDAIVSGGGWQNPDNIFANDDALTVAVHTELASDWYLKTNGFGFDTNVIPSNAVILKVELQTKWKFEITG